MRWMLALLIVATPALGEPTYPGGRKIECYCTDSTGRRVELGQQICLTVNGRSFTAECQMSLNTPMWREIKEGCVSSSLGRDASPHGGPATGRAAQG